MFFNFSFIEFAARYHLAEIIIMNPLIQGCNNMTGFLVEPTSYYGQNCCVHDGFSVHGEYLEGSNVCGSRFS